MDVHNVPSPSVFEIEISNEIAQLTRACAMLPANRWSAVPSPITESFRISGVEVWAWSSGRKMSGSDAT